MSIYIKGMEMPANCNKCPFLDYEEGFCFASGIKGESGWYEYILRPGSNKDGRHGDCPLGHVPEHGDLIDRVAFREEMDKHYPFDKYTQSNHGWEDSAKSAVIKILATAPTIIPADSVKEEKTE